MCYVDRLKDSMYLVNARLVVGNATKTSNTTLDLRNAATSLQIEGKRGCYLGTQPIGGGGETEDGTIYTYTDIIIERYMYAHTHSLSPSLSLYIYIYRRRKIRIE